MRIEPGHEDYEAMEKIWKREGGTTFAWKGSEWLVIRDGDIYAFVRIDSASGIDNRYQSSSVG